MKLFFDLDGTLIDITKRHYHVYFDTVKTLGGQPIDKKNYWKLKRDKTDFSKIIKKSLISEKLIPNFREIFTSKIELKEYLKMDTLFSYTIPQLKILSSQKHSLYLISYRENKVNALNQIKQLGILDMFRKTEFGKNKNVGFKTKAKFISNFCFKNSEILIIGDTEDDILAAKELNAISIAVLSGIRNKQQLIKYKPDYIISSIRMVPYIIKSIKK